MKRKKIKSVWKEYLTLSMRERRGLSILLGILLFQIIFLFYLNNVDLKYPYPDLETVKKLQKEIEMEALTLKVIEKPLPEISTLHSFDPNKLNAEQWMKFGLSEKQSNSVLNYLKKGGKFRVKKDVLKIYGMNERLYAELHPFISLPDSFTKEKNQYHPKVKTSFELLEINTADSIQLEKLRGIGPTLASRIIRYRNRLGGFISIEQLKEVYGVNDTLFNLIKDQVVVNDNDVRVVVLNVDSFPVLASHPYIGKKLAGLILTYRKQHKRFESTDDLKNLPLLTDEIFRKLVPYLKVD